MSKLLRYTTTYGDDITVTYWRALIANDTEAHERAEQLNDKDKSDLDAYNEACGNGSAGIVKQKVEEVDG